jgi:DNA primase
VAKLVEANCRNVGALMGTAVSEQQIERLTWIRTHVGFSHMLLFLDRDRAGRQAMQQAKERLRHLNLQVRVFDWDQKLSRNGQRAELIPESIQDPADMPVEQLRWLRSQRII